MPGGFARILRPSSGGIISPVADNNGPERPPSGLNPQALRLEDLARILTASRGRQAAVEKLQADIDAAARLNPDRTATHPAPDATGTDLTPDAHHKMGTDLTHNDADHHPKYYVVRWINRVG